MPSCPRVLILIVAYRGRALLPGCIEALMRTEERELAQRIVVVENGSGDETAEWLRTQYPQVDVLALPENLGFAAGNNRGWEWAAAQYPQVEYLALINQDVTVTPGWLPPLVARLESDRSLASVQPTICFDPPREQINTLGTLSHFLGFGFPRGYRSTLAELKSGEDRVDSVSGAACVLRADVVRRLGLFDPRFFMYLEDVELGWKLRLAGYDHAWVRESTVFHQYTFRDDFRYYYYLERNRLWLLLVFLRLRTLALLLPAALLMELGQGFFAVRRGRLLDKLRSYGYFLRPSIWRELLARRRELQTLRVLTDREFTARFIGQIESPELTRWAIVRWIASPVFSIYWACLRRLIR